MFSSFDMGKRKEIWIMGIMGNMEIMGNTEIKIQVCHLLLIKLYILGMLFCIDLSIK